MPTYLALVTTCLVVCLAILVSRRPLLNGTTMIGPFRWSLFSLSSLLAAEVYASLAHDGGVATVQAVRYVAATTTFCPLVAVLGAKRPQNNGWQFIVVSLWIVLILPAAETLILWRGGQLAAGPIRRWLMAILLLVELSNYLPTRYGIAAILTTAGQIVLLRQYLPFPLPGKVSSLTGVLLITFGIVIAWLCAGRSQRSGWERVWLDFRDTFGTVWGLRVMERVNATAQLCDWNTRLRWTGFTSETSVDENKDSEAQHDLARTMRTVLRRFVSADWIDRRLQAR